MALLEAALIFGFLLVVLVFLISAIPLYLAVKFLGGKTSLLKTAFVALLSGIIVSAIQFRFRVWGALLAFFVLIWIYHEAFRLVWIKAFFAWVLQLLFLALFYAVLIILGIMLGISLLPAAIF